MSTSGWNIQIWNLWMFAYTRNQELWVYLWMGIFQVLFPISETIPGGGTQRKKWVRMRGPLPKTLYDQKIFFTQFMT